MRQLARAVVVAGACACLLAACSGTSPSSSGTTAPSMAAPGAPPDGGPGGPPPGGGSQTENSGTAATTFHTDTTTSGGSYTSTKADENAVRVEGGATVSLSDSTVDKTGDSSSTGDSDFYGMNAGILVRDRGALTLTGGSVTTDAAGGNGIFVYGTGSSATVSGTRVRTSSNNSGGIEVAGGGSIDATNLDIATQGPSAAAIRSDRGGGTITVDQGTYSTSGTGSPAVYSTADVSVSNATLAANGSEAVVIEGANSVKLTDSSATGNMQGTYGASSGENIHGVMIYQSMSGDASQGPGSFTMTGGSLTTKTGDLFYVTNTTATIDLTGVALTTADGNLLTVSGNDGSRGWGSAGSNGGTCTLTASGQTMAGTVAVDKISSLDLTLKDGSSFTGTVNPSGTAGTVDVTLSADSTWTLTADAHLSSFSGSTSRITTGGHHVYVNDKVLV